MGTTLDKLESLLAEVIEDVDEAASLIAALLGIDGEGRYGKLQFAPQAQRTRTLDTLLRQLVGNRSQQASIGRDRGCSLD